MRTTVFLLLLAAVASAAPAEEEIDRLSARVLSLLGAEAPRDRAWGAYLAGKHGIAAAVPRLVALLESLPDADEDADADAAGPLGRAALDALMRLGVEPDLDLLRALAPRYPDPVLILLSTRGEAAAPALRPLFDRRDGVRPMTRRAVLALGTHWRLPGVAAELLRGLEIRARVDVVPADQRIGIAGGVGGGGGMIRELLVDRPGWPPAVRWVFRDRPAPGLMVLVPWPAPLSWSRVEVARGTEIGVNRPGPFKADGEFRLAALAWLADVDLDRLRLEYRPDHLVFYESDEQYVREVEKWLGELRERRGRLMEALVRRAAITEEEAKELAPPIELKVWDRRGGGDPLPEIDAAAPPPLTLARVDAPGPAPEELTAPSVTVEVRADGTILYEGKPQDRESLIRALRPLADATRDEDDPLRGSRLGLIVRADRHAAWGRVGVVLKAAGDPGVCAGRLRFVVASPDTSERTLFVPLLHFSRGTGVELRISYAGVAVGTEMLEAALRGFLARHPGRWLGFDCSADVPAEYALRALAAARRIGIEGVVVYVNRADPAPAGPVSGDRFAVRIDDRPVDAEGALGEPDPRWTVTGAPPEAIRTALEALPSPPAPLAILAFLEVGESHRYGPHRAPVKQGLKLLKRRQEADGLFPDDAGEATLAPHALATLVMVRVYEQTYSPLFKQSAQHGLDRLAKWEDPDAAGGADWAAAAILAGKRAGLRLPDAKVEGASARLGTPPGDPPASADPADWLPGLLRAIHAGGDVAARWRAAVEERFAAAPAPDSSPALRAYLLALAWRSR